MTAAQAPSIGKAASTPGGGLLDWLEGALPKIVVAPTFISALVFIYGFILWNGYLSLTSSRMLPNYHFAGFIQYATLFANERWWTALRNLALFGSLFVFGCLAVGLFLAILLDQKIRAEGFIRSIYMYPMALSFVVTGTAWKWILNPGLGIEKTVREMGYPHFNFDWLVNPEFSIYTVVIAGLWQSSGFVMALFLAGLRGVDDSIIKAAQVDGASLPVIYWRIVIPSLRPVFFSAFIILSHIAIKSFDLVMALTGGGPGFSSDLPATFMYTFSFTRNQIGMGAASAMMMMMIVVAVVIPMMYSELRRGRHD
ncbi:MAG: sugar ABC transporter permease [Betaproteobacteria bacterium]|nr:sugar ABC transporter permease [Betaproteobacteria bacterium]